MLFLFSGYIFIVVITFVTHVHIVKLNTSFKDLKIIIFMIFVKTKTMKKYGLQGNRLLLMYIKLGLMGRGFNIFRPGSTLLLEGILGRAQWALANHGTSGKIVCYSFPR